MVEIRRVVFTKARIAALIRDVKAKTKLPEWAVEAQVRNGKLFIQNREVVPRESISSWLRSRVYDKNKKPVNMSRDGGWTDFLERETYGISRRVWMSWLSRQDIHQRGLARPKPAKSPGQKIYSRGTVEIDLVEAKQKDLPGKRTTDTYFFTMIDKLTNWLVCKRIDTKSVDPSKEKPPRKQRGTLVVLRELLDEMEKALGKKVKRLYSDDGAEFKAGILPMLKARGITKTVVPLGATIENANGQLQRRFYTLVKQKRGGTVDKLLAEAVELCNTQTNRILKMRPIDALKESDKLLEGRYNDARQRPGKQLGPKIRVGDSVRYLLTARKADKFYKSYRDKYSSVYRVSFIRGNTLTINGKTYPRNRVVLVKPLDQESKKLIDSRGAKKKLTVEQKKRRAATKKEAKQVEREHYKAAPRRSGRAAVKAIHKK